jgi:heme-degrading monooxygenase HmoA
MIARIWHAWTAPEDVAAYEALLRSEILPALHRIEGFAGADLLRHKSASEVEFIVVTFFDSWEALRRFAGEQYEQAVVSAKVRGLLSRFDPSCLHFELVARADVAI